MKFKTHNETDINAVGTWGRGRIETTYARLVEVFGEPFHDTCGHKVDWEWTIEFTDDDETIIATIYNWKNGPNYCGDEGEHCTDITEWNVGGSSGWSLALVREALAGGGA